MKRDDMPPPMPPRYGDGDDATMLQHGVLKDELDAEDALLADLPDALPDDAPPPVRPATGAKVSVRSLDDGFPIHESTHERAVRQQHNAERRVPVETRKRPTLMPSGFDAPPKLPSARRDADPALVRPMRPAEGGGKNVGDQRESSDVIQMFPATAPQPAPMFQKQRTSPPPQPQGRLIRSGPRPQQPGYQTAPPPSHQNHQPPGYATAPPQAGHRPPASIFPLQSERLAAAIAEHRARQQWLDLYARALEIGGGLFGTVALAVLIASLVAILLGNGQSLVAAGTAVVSSLAGLALSGLMVAGAAGLRQIGHNTAQLAALLDALSQPPR